MESRSAEPLQSLTNSKHRSSSNSNSFKKKKRRRRNKRTPKSAGPEDRPSIAPVASIASRDDTPTTPHRGPPTPVLRPAGTQVPRAPENSTQFIMDDHENSALFLNFDKSTPWWEEEPSVSGGEEDTGNATPTHALTRDWYPFNLADFETAYRSAREDRLMGGTRDDLCAAIVALETRAAVLTEALSASPSRLVATLQAQLLQLQEENSALRQRLVRQNKQPQQSSSSSSTDSDSESDSTNSSSNCSESDCDTCAARRSVTHHEEEKENTRPPTLPFS